MLDPKDVKAVHKPGRDTSRKHTCTCEENGTDRTVTQVDQMKKMTDHNIGCKYQGKHRVMKPSYVTYLATIN